MTQTTFGHLRNEHKNPPHVFRNQPVGRRIGNAFASGTEGVKFNYQAGQIGYRYNLF